MRSILALKPGAGHTAEDPMKARHGVQSAVYFILAMYMLVPGSVCAVEKDNRNSEERKPYFMLPERHDISPPLREMVLEREPSSQDYSPRSIPLRPGPPLTTSDPEALRQVPSPNSPFMSISQRLGTTNLVQFDGMCNTSPAVVPPDSNASIGRTQIVETVNDWLGIYGRD